MSLLSEFQQALNITGPILILLLLGVIFKQIGFISREFVAVGNKLVFNVALPCLLFLSTATGSLNYTVKSPLIVFSIVAIIVVVIIIWFLSKFLVSENKRGVFTQCAFRGNLAIIGLSLCVNAFGSQVLAKVGIYVALLTILYNILTVLLLGNNKVSMIGNLLKNPLIIGIVAGLLWSSTGWYLPQIAAQSVGYLSQMTLPLALLCIGASLDWHSLKINHRDVIIATVFKLFIVPFVVIACAIAWGFSGENLAILFLMMASPTAAAAYVMSKQMTPYGAMAAEIITLSSALSPISITLGFAILNYYGFV